MFAVVVVSTTGEEVAGLGRPIADASEMVQRALSGATATRHEDGRFTTAVPVSTQGTTIGAVVLDRSSGAVDAQVRRYWAALAVLVLVASAVVGFSGLLLARFVSGPLDDLRRVANRLGAGDLTARATTGRGPAEVQDLAEDFNRTAGRLAALLRSQSTFAADASHQLRTPLTALRLQLENLAADVEAEGVLSATRADVDAAIAESERLSRLVDGLLALARAEPPAPADGAPRAHIDVDDVLRGRVEAWQPLAVELGIDLRQGRPQPASVVADLDRLTQSLDNLIATALDATPAGGHVELSAVRVGDRVQLHVIDDGRGLRRGGAGVGLRSLLASTGCDHGTFRWLRTGARHRGQPR